MGEFSPLPPFLNHADAQTTNTSTRLWFYYIITKIDPPFQNPGSVPGYEVLHCKKTARPLSYPKDQQL